MIRALPLALGAAVAVALSAGLHLMAKPGGTGGKSRIPTVSADMSGTSGGAGSSDSGNGGGGH